MIRVRPLDVKGLVNETYELLEDGKLDRLGRRRSGVHKEVHVG